MMKPEGGKETLGFDRSFPEAVQRGTALTRTLGIYWRFLVAGLTRVGYDRADLELTYTGRERGRNSGRQQCAQAAA